MSTIEENIRRFEELMDSVQKDVFQQDKEHIFHSHTLTRNYLKIIPSHTQLLSFIGHPAKLRRYPPKSFRCSQ